MKPQLLLIPMLLLGACRTTAGTKEKTNMLTQASAKSEILLRKRIGAMPDHKDQIYDCTVTGADVPNPADVKKLIAEVPRKESDIIQAFHIVATVPSIEIYAYEGTQEILIFRDHSTMEFPGADNKKHPAAVKLEEIAKKHCPGPK